MFRTRDARVVQTPSRTVALVAPGNPTSASIRSQT